MTNLTIRPQLIARIKADEGFEREAYPDPLSPLGVACRRAKIPMRAYKTIPNHAALSGSPWTIGVGHTGAEVKRGLVWSLEQIEAQLKADLLRHAEMVVKDEPWILTLDPVRQDVLFNMAFNMGWNPRAKPGEKKGLAGFSTTLAMFRARNFTGAASNMLLSAWAKQVGARAERLARMTRTGVYV